MLTNQHVLRFRGTLAAFEEAAGDLRRLLDDHRLDARLRYNVELVFEEIATNIIRHGSPNADVEAGVVFGDDEIVLTFDDDGTPFDPRAQPEPPVPLSIEESEPGGLGLVLVRKISARMDYERTPQQRNHLLVAIPVR